MADTYSVVNDVGEIALARARKASPAHPGTLRWYADVAKRVVGASHAGANAQVWDRVEIVVEVGVRAWLPWVRRRIARLVAAAVSIARPSGGTVSVRVVRKLKPGEALC